MHPRVYGGGPHERCLITALSALLPTVRALLPPSYRKGVALISRFNKQILDLLEGTSELKAQLNLKLEAS